MTRILAILGGCGGIGRTLVAQARSAGYEPVVYDLATSIAAHPLAGVEAIAVDASDPDALEAGLAQGPDRVDGFVNLCGFMTPPRPVAAQDIATWSHVIDGNLNAAFYAARAMTPRLGDGGAMVLAGSGLGHNARPGFGPYAVSKAGISALTRQLALELAPQIRVNCVAPSAVDTDFLRGGTGRSGDAAPPVDLEAYAAAIPMQRIAVPQDVTGPILFLLSDAAGYITGQTLQINGGAYMP